MACRTIILLKIRLSNLHEIWIELHGLWLLPPGQIGLKIDRLPGTQLEIRHPPRPADFQRVPQKTGQLAGLILTPDV